MRTTEQLIAAMLQRLGKSPSQSSRVYNGRTYQVGVNLIQVLNDAGRDLVKAKPWAWKTQTLVVPFVSNQDSYALPLNTLALVDAGFPDGGARTVEVVTLARVREDRKRDVVVSELTEFHVALGGGVQDTPGLPLRRSLEIYPRPSGAGLELEVTLELGWTDLVESDPDRVPALPPHFDRAMYLAARHFAWKDQNTSKSPDEDEYRAELERLWEVDQSEQTTYGPMRGGIEVSADDDPGYHTGRFDVQF